jgi:hypothetical protein
MTKREKRLDQIIGNLPEIMKFAGVYQTDAEKVTQLVKYMLDTYPPVRRPEPMVDTGTRVADTQTNTTGA